MSAARSIVLLDGGMGQELIRRTGATPAPLWSAQVMLDAPQAVEDLHLDYIRAGARVITLNAYSAEPTRLAKFGDPASFEPLQRAACDLAARARDRAGAAGAEVRIAGCLPPLEWSYRPEIAREAGEAEAIYARVVALQAPHVDLFLCETLAAAGEARGRGAGRRGLGQAGVALLDGGRASRRAAAQRREHRGGGRGARRRAGGGADDELLLARGDRGGDAGPEGDREALRRLRQCLHALRRGPCGGKHRGEPARARGSGAGGLCGPRDGLGRGGGLAGGRLLRDRAGAYRGDRAAPRGARVFHRWGPGMSELPAAARAVVIGGGVSGCSVAYHLGKLGWRDVVLLERKQLTCGTTWHAAGLIGQLRASQNMTRLAKYSADLYARLEAETGIATGLRQCGSITLALTEARREEILRQASLARAFDIEVQEIGPQDVAGLYPHVNVADVVAAVHLPGDGQCDPANIAMALAKGARAQGVRIVEGVTVSAVRQAGGRVTGVDWRRGAETGHIAADIVVNCGGMWARDLAASSGVTLPLHACEHFYIVTEPIAGLGRLPVLRVPDECAYYKEDAGKLLLGAFEPVAKPWGMGGIPEDFAFDQLAEDVDHFAPILEKAVERVPLLGEAGVQTFFNGPESFTPDDRYYLGEAPEVGGYWVAAGYNSIGIVSSGGAGYALAEWIAEGEPPFDLWEVDIRRAQPFQRNRRYLRERVTETLGLLYADHFPYRQMATARGVRRSPVHAALAERGAVFGEVAGWERANWFAAPGEAREYRYDWGRQNWFDNQRAEHLAVRTGVGLFDMSSFGKIRVEGRDATAFLQRLCGNDLDVEAGRIVYTQMLNARGGIESDLTVTRLGETAFLLVVPAATLRRDLAWLRRHLGEAAAVVTDVTAGEAVFCVMGPKAREADARGQSRRFLERRLPLRDGARDRDRHGARAGASRDLCGRARLGALCLDRPGSACLRDAGGSRGGTRAQALRAACAGFMPHREGLPAFRP